MGKIEYLGDGLFAMPISLMERMEQSELNDDQMTFYVMYKLGNDYVSKFGEEKSKILIQELVDKGFIDLSNNENQ